MNINNFLFMFILENNQILLKKTNKIYCKIKSFNDLVFCNILIILELNNIKQN